MKEAIINLLRKWGCCHEWKQEQPVRIIDNDGNVTGYKWLYICKKCGKMKWVKA